jgi:mRNA interferase HigB
MRVISHRKIIEFGGKYPDSINALETWHKIVTKTDYSSLADLKKTLPGTDFVDGLYVFNIGGNKFRLIAAIHFNTGMVFIRHILTHSEYDKNKWKE